LLRIAAGLLVLGTAGCAWLQAPDAAPAPPAAATPPVAPPVVPTVVPPSPHSREGEEVMALLAYYRRLLAMPADDLRREYQTASQAFARDKAELTRFRLALLLAVPGVAWRDDERLLALLDGAASRTAATESPRHQFVLLLQKLVAERLREQRRADELQQKLDAMLRIERGLRERRK
jgi:hypothetical protein